MSAEFSRPCSIAASAETRWRADQLIDDWIRNRVRADIGRLDQ